MLGRRQRNKPENTVLYSVCRQIGQWQQTASEVYYAHRSIYGFVCFASYWEYAELCDFKMDTQAALVVLIVSDYTTDTYSK